MGLCSGRHLTLYIRRPRGQCSLSDCRAFYKESRQEGISGIRKERVGQVRKGWEKGDGIARLQGVNTYCQHKNGLTKISTDANHGDVRVRQRAESHGTEAADVFGMIAPRLFSILRETSSRSCYRRTG